MSARFVALSFLLSCAIFCELPGKAQAATAHYLAVDRQSNGLPATVESGDWVQIYVAGRASYCCEVRDVGASVFFASQNIDLIYDGGPAVITGTFRGTEPPFPFNASARMCFIVPAAVSVGTAVLPLFANTSPTTNVLMQCEETTLYGGYNTSVTNFNFLEMTNLQLPTGQVLVGAVTAKNVVPVPNVTVIDQAPFTISGDSRYDFDIHQRTGAGAFGPLKVVHDGAPGGLKAVITQYNIVTPTPLTFAPVAQEVLRTRSAVAGPAK